MSDLKDRPSEVALTAGQHHTGPATCGAHAPFVNGARRGAPE
jgi:hypothetical protein